MVAVRRLSTVASAAAILLFVVSAAMRSLPLGTSASAPAAAPAPNAALDSARGGATSASAAPQATGDQQYGVPAAAPTSPGAAFGIVPTATPKAAERTQLSTEPAKRQDTGSASPSPDLALTARSSNAAEQPPFNPFPWLWLVLGVAFAALSWILGRRLRST